MTTENSSVASELHEKNRYGSLLADGRIRLSLLEAVYLLEKSRISVVDGRNREVSLADLERKASAK